MKTPMRVHCLQHEPFEGLGNLEPWFQSRGAQITITHLYRDSGLPDPREVDWLVVMGGGMSANDEAVFPWLVAEKRFIRAVMDADRTVLGVCLGAQLIASVLGATVRPNTHREIGWWPIMREPRLEPEPWGRVFPERAEVFHWHGETFELPPGAVRLARSEGCLNQAFAWGRRVLGVQFHLETSPSAAQGLIDGCPGDLVPGPYVQDASTMLGEPERFRRLRLLLEPVLETLRAASG